jgi:chemotaxis protein CheD
VSLHTRESRPTVHVVQGGLAIGRDPDCVIGTILGSCVSACLWDPEARVGGMNHIVLPERAGQWSKLVSHGASEMERLIDALVREGASRTRLRAKVFGGANMIPALPDIGGRNAEFLIGYLDRESIPIDSSSLGGNQARMIRFWPHSGRARQRLVDRADEQAPTPLQTGNGLELF